MVEAVPESTTTHSVTAGATYWFTGLSGAGKSTLSGALKQQIDKLVGDKNKVFLLDGDVIRTGLNKDLGFSPEDRAENIRRITEVSKLFCMSGQIVFVAFISPYSKDRDLAKEAHAAAGLKFYECHISASLEVCEGRDVKGLYAKARAGTIPNFTGVSAPYEAPANPDMNIDTGSNSLETCQQMVINQMVASGVLKSNAQREIAASMWAAPSEERATEIAALKKLDINKHQVEYLQTIGDGFAAPLARFMNEMELLEVMNMKTLTDASGKKHLLSVPITQDISEEQKGELEGEQAVAITCTALGTDEVLAVINKPVVYDNRKEEICARTFGCMSANHPKAQTIFAQGDFLISGESMEFVKRPVFNDGNDVYRLTPSEIQAKITEKDADVVYAFQVRNPLHNGHVLLLKDTREQLIAQGFRNPILLLHPLGGWCKDDDVPLNERMQQHQALLNDGTLNPEHTILAVWPSPMYYGGPTEVLWHASSRVTCGITHFITGRDPAGVGHPEKAGVPLYDVWHGQKLLVHNKSMLKGVEVLPFKVAAYNTVRQRMEFFGGPGCNKEEFEFISGSRMRQMARDNEDPPAGFMSPAGWEVLKAYYQSQ